MIKVQLNSQIEIPHISLSIRDINSLIPICKTGMPDSISPEMAEALQTLVCLAINPLRGLEIKEGSHE